MSTKQNNLMPGLQPNQTVAKVVLRDGRATLTVNDVPIGPMAFTPSVVHAGITPDVAERLAEAGVNVFFITYDSGWQDKASWRRSDDEVSSILAANPEAWIIARVKCFVPESWVDENPDELNTFEDGRTDHYENIGYSVFDHRCVCLASDKYAEGSARHIEELIDHFANTPFANRIIGYFLLGLPSEWHYNSCYDGSKHCLGFSPAFKRHYSKWLKAKYGSEKQLRDAWKNQSASFDSPHIPSLTERCFNPPRIPATSNLSQYEKLSTETWCGYPFFQRLSFKADFGSFLNPETSQCAIDYFEAHTAGTATTIDAIAKAIKKKTNDTVVVGAFFGIVSLYSHAASVAGVQMMQDSAYIDFLSAPNVYEDRVPGGGATYRTPVDSYAYRGKLWFNENDSRTWRCAHWDIVNFGGVYNCAETLEVLKRDFAQNICDDVNSWWFDQGAGDMSYYDDPNIYELFKRQQEIAADYYSHKRQKASQIAIVYDQDSIWATDPETARDMMHFNRFLEIPRIGAPCDHILLRDLELECLPDYKMYVFVNCFVVDKYKRELIERTVKRNGNTAVWIYAQGLINPDATNKLDLRNMEELAGMRFACDNGPREGTFRISDSSHKLTERLSPYTNYGCYTRPILTGFGWKKGKMLVIQPSFLDPIIYIDDEDVTPLGTFIANGKVSYGMKQMDGWQSVFLGAKAINSPILRAIAKNAGVHIYLESDDLLYANRHFVAVHATVEGDKHISFPQTCKSIMDAYTKEHYTLGEDNSLDIKMPAGTTQMFQIA